jgi:hypothetical protein
MRDDVLRFLQYKLNMYRTQLSEQRRHMLNRAYPIITEENIEGALSICERTLRKDEELGQSDKDSRTISP